MFPRSNLEVFFLRKNVVVFMSPFFWQFFTNALLINEKFVFGMLATLTTSKNSHK